VAEDMFDRLLTALPRIAESVNKFESPAVQEHAFEALVRALGITEPIATTPPAPSNGSADSATGDMNGDAGGVEEIEATNGTPRRRRRRAASALVSAVRDIDLRPDGKQSFRDFAAEKQPSTKEERNIIAVYYLEQVLNLSEIKAGHVLAAYKECNWPEPNDMRHSLRVTSSRRHWLDTSDRTSIHTTAPGRNLVKHDLPRTPKATKREG
jgi:hypothetical protein